MLLLIFDCFLPILALYLKMNNAKCIDVILLSARGRFRHAQHVWRNRGPHGPDNETAARHFLACGATLWRTMTFKISFGLAGHFVAAAWRADRLRFSCQKIYVRAPFLPKKAQLNFNLFTSGSFAT